MIYSIKEDISYDNLLASYDTGNKRSDLQARPRFGVSDYTECSFGVSENGLVYPTNTCRVKTAAQNGSQPSFDNIINGIELRKT